MKGKGALAVLKVYFGYRSGDGLKEFSAELNQLSDKEKLELAQLAAKALGLTQADVDFNLG